MIAPLTEDGRRVCVIGAGAVGLITAHVLREDGFDVQVLTRDKTAGGVWAQGRVYPGIALNNVIGEYSFSPLPMPPPPDAKKSGGRLTGDVMQKYFEDFAETLLVNVIRYEVEVNSVSRKESGIWVVKVSDLKTGQKEDLAFDKVVLATGGCSVPRFPSSLTPEDAIQAGFKGIVIHSASFGTELENIIRAVKPKSEGGGCIVVVGGGKSAQDIVANLIRAGRDVKMVFENCDAFIANPFPLPDFIRKSRFLSVMSPHIELKTRLERFLHTTYFGAAIVRRVWGFLTNSALDLFEIPKNSVFRIHAASVFWSVKVNDEGVASLNSFFQLVKQGDVDAIAPARVACFAPGGSGVILDDGRKIEAEAVVLATGYGSSWEKILDEKTREEIGLLNYEPNDLSKYTDKWDYVTLKDPPKPPTNGAMSSTSLYRGFVPARNIHRHDFAVNGTMLTTHNGFTFEVGSHWISSYLRKDSNLRLPNSVEEALEHNEMTTAWLARRYPGQLTWLNESYNGGTAFWTCPQLIDDLLGDMGLRTMRSGGNWFNWPFQVISLSQIENLHQEREESRRRALRV